MSAPPIHDAQAEQATLGGCLLSRDVALDIIEILEGQDFHVPRHEVIFDAIRRLAIAGNPTDVIAVADDLIQHGKAHEAGGIDYIHTLTSAVPTAQQGMYYADIVKDRAVRRRVVEAAAFTIQSAPSSDLATLVETARQRMDDALGVPKQPVVYVGDLIEEVVADAERPRRIYPTPWKGLDDILGGGFRPGALYVLAARTAIGKTAIALQIASALAASGPTAFASLEMPREELVRHIISQGAQIPHHHLERGQPLPEFMKIKIEDWATGQWAPHGLAIDDRSTVTVSDTRTFARAVRRPSDRLVGIVADYLQLYQGPTGMKRYEVVTELSRQFKLLAREMDCPVILLSQLNRDPEKRVDKRPTLADLRDSGAIEQDADVVMMLYRDPNFDAGPASSLPPKQGVPLELNVAKNRHGPSLMHTLSWEGSQMRAYG